MFVGPRYTLMDIYEIKVFEFRLITGHINRFEQHIKVKTNLLLMMNKWILNKKEVKFRKFHFPFQIS